MLPLKKGVYINDVVLVQIHGNTIDTFEGIFAGNPHLSYD